MNALNAILPVGLVIGALFALFFAFSKPVGTLPRWVRHAYLSLSAGMGGWGVVSYIKTHYQSSISEQTYSLILQASARLAGFSLAILLVLMLAGVFPRLFGRPDRSEPPATCFFMREEQIRWRTNRLQATRDRVSVSNRTSLVRRA